jgi:hypothetical protein
VKKVLLCLSVAVAATTAATGALGAGAPPRDVASLTRTAAKLSGLPVRHRVTTKVLSAQAMKAQARRLLNRDYPLPQQRHDEAVYRALGLLPDGEALRPLLLAAGVDGAAALYDPVTRVLYARKGTARLPLLHELVHALEDQSFRLSTVTTLRRRDRDAALAASAAIEGEAAFVSQVLGGRVVAVAPRRTAAAAAPLATFLTLEQQYPDTVGMRFVATLHNLGGNSAVFSALRQLPTTTAQTFHVDDFLMRTGAQPVQLPQSAGSLALRSSDTFGELDVRALLAVFGAPRLDVAAEGWAGGRSAVYGDASGRTAVALVLTWETDDDVQEWRDAATAYVGHAFAAASGGPRPTDCGDDTCWSAGDRAVAFAADGTRTALVVGPDASTADAVARAATD